MRLFAASEGEGKMTAVLMPFLGGSHREWRGVVRALSTTERCVGLDLPGFGESAEVAGYTVEQMAESVLETLGAEGVTGAEAEGSFVLVGHSMAGKVCAVLARWAADGDARLRGLRGLVLVCPSPPSPEPMEAKKRAQMLELLGGEPGTDERGRRRDREAATRYIRENANADLPKATVARAAEEVLRMDRGAWRAWLEGGSKEDWSERVNVLSLPVLVVAGDKDEALGPNAQKSWTMPHFPHGRLATLHSNHLVPMEKPKELARLIAEFVRGVEGEGVRAAGVQRDGVEIPMDRAYVDLILSDRVSEATRRALEPRAEADVVQPPRSLTVLELVQLRAVTERVVPQRGVVQIDLAGRLDRQMAERAGDGWRYAELPPDAEACRAALRSLEWHARAEAGKGWLALTVEEQESMLGRAQAGKLGRRMRERLGAVMGAGPDGEPALTAGQMRLWFEDLRAEATKVYVGHPATLDRMGYSGIADGAESRPGVGFVRIGIGEVEGWEPERVEDRRGR